MDKNVFKVEGFVTGVSKKTSKSYVMLHVSREFQGSSTTQMRQGREVLQQYIEGTVPQGLTVGCTVAFDYTINGAGFPSVCGVRVVK